MNVVTGVSHAIVSDRLGGRCLASIVKETVDKDIW